MHMLRLRPSRLTTQLSSEPHVVLQDALSLLDAGQRARLSGLLESVGLMVTERPPSLFSAKHLEGDLAKVIRVRAQLAAAAADRLQSLAGKQRTRSTP